VKKKTQDNAQVIQSAREASKQVKALRRTGEKERNNRGTSYECNSNPAQSVQKNFTSEKLPNETVGALTNSGEDPSVTSSSEVKLFVSTEIQKCESRIKNHAWAMLGIFLTVCLTAFGGYWTFINYRLDDMQKDQSELKNSVLSRKDIVEKCLKK
jgi:hypothetical protein